MGARRLTNKRTLRAHREAGISRNGDSGEREGCGARGLGSSSCRKRKLGRRGDAADFGVDDAGDGENAKHHGGGEQLGAGGGIGKHENCDGGEE